jgi:hypothetical protein
MGVKNAFALTNIAKYNKKWHNNDYAEKTYTIA